ncbi:hypothetical protein Glove_139g210 [Diversispora epigaea]|uniref:Uncharacterized protein n=1 Tax=Diversispora epigaea TaxID=1348612 RepID=A0A397J523_9GLOM|nr:hypothetical protein Glove_139g210 [Diversispora epigaea]
MRRVRQLHFPTGNLPQTHNIGRCFNKITTSIRHIFNNVRMCSYRDAKLFSTETQGTCCAFGKIKLTSASDTIILNDLFTRNDDIGKDF